MWFGLNQCESRAHSPIIDGVWSTGYDSIEMQGLAFVQLGAGLGVWIFRL